MDPLEIMLTSGSNRDDDMQKALSSGLRRRREISELAQITGDEVLTPFGQNLAQSVARDTTLEKASMEKAAQRELTSQYYEQMAQQSALANTMALRRQEEYERHNRATEKNQLLRATSAGMKTPTVSAQKRTDEAKESYEGIRRVLGSYKSDYANNSYIPFEGSLSNTLGKYTGTDAQKDQSRWWADYDLLYTLGRRNKLFGSALTDSEIRAWEGANIGPNSPPEVIERGLKTLSEIAERKIKEQYANDAPLYKPEWVQSVYGDLQPLPQFGEDVQSSPAGQDGDRPAGGQAGDGSMIWGEMK